MNVVHGEQLFVSVKCVNKIGYSTLKVSSPIIISVEPPAADHAFLKFDPQLLSRVFPRNDNEQSMAIQTDNSRLQFFWEGFADKSGILFYEYRVLVSNNHLTEWINAGQKKFVTYINPNLIDGQNYTAEVRAVNQGNLRSETIRASIMIDSTGPMLTGLYNNN